MKKQIEKEFLGVSKYKLLGLCVGSLIGTTIISTADAINGTFEASHLFSTFAGGLVVGFILVKFFDISLRKKNEKGKNKKRRS